MYAFDPDRLAKLEALRADGIPPYPTGFVPDLTAAGAAQLGEQAEDLAVLRRDFAFAGRLLFKNEMGKAGFGRVLDATGRLQIYVRRDDVGEHGFALWKRLDLGDIVGVRGFLMRTRTGELTLQATAVELVAKCIKSLPDKFHGMSDPELKQRQRYLDLFANPEVRETFVHRSRIVRYIRNYFEARGFLEVETPMMQPIPGGATARPFVTHHNALDADLYLRIAPELFLKRLVVGGMEKVFEVNRNFRNEGIDSTHNPEFTMLEFYEAYASWSKHVDLTEDLLHGLAVDVCGAERVPWQGGEISFALPFRRARYGDLVAQASGVADVYDLDALRAFIGPDAPLTLGHCWERIFDEHVERTLHDPTFVTHFPVEISPLARRNDADARLTDRFELFVAGREVANGFNELNDPVDQAERFATQARRRAGGDAEAMYFDADYIEALSYAMPPTAGEGIGIDRLVMLLTDSPSIRDVILFPTLRPRA